ncbi:MAG TPA: hypothetical protein VEL74_21400, partial [Thermoanaerobaculia bacterium]|nr:hypothetical protein [Thermoanaerobaculia bacterium]
MSEPEEPSSPPDAPAGGERRRGDRRRRGSGAWEGPERRAAERRRPGRVRRWVVRPFVWGLLIVALVLLGALLFIESRYAHQRAADLVVARLGDVLNRKIEVGGVDYGFAPLSFELRDLVIAGPRPEDPPFAVVPFVRFQFSWRDLRQRVLRLEQIEAIGPRIYVRFNPDGTSNLPQLRRQPQRTRRFEVQVGRILVEGGSVQLDEKRLPLDIEARGVWGRLIGRAERQGEGGNRFDAWLTVPEIRTTLPNARPYPYEILAAKGSFEPGRIRIASALMSGP